MNEELLRRIDALSEKMGTTAESLYAALVDDVVRRGWIGFGAGVLCVLWGVALGVRATNLYAATKARNDEARKDLTPSLLRDARPYRVLYDEFPTEAVIYGAASAGFILSGFLGGLAGLFEATAPNVAVLKILFGS